MLTLWVSKKMLLPDTRTGSTFGISLTPIEPGPSSMKLTIIDFPFIFNFVKKAWLGQTTANSGVSIYSLGNHLKITNDWVGIKPNNTLPFGYSPTMLWVLEPLVFFAHNLAYCLFNITGLFSVWWITRAAVASPAIGLFAGNRMVLFIAKISLVIFIVGSLRRATLKANPCFNISTIKG